jgi:Zn2+/Cd2+-exporting ATPase
VHLSGCSYDGDVDPGPASPTSREPLRYRAETPDCPTCAVTIETDAERSAAWYATTAGRHALVVATLLLAGFLASWIAPVSAPWLYALATIIGVAPLARTAVTNAAHGAPFGIATLVTLAAGGALVIGEYAEGAVVVMLFLVGEMLERVAAGRARRAITALASLRPRTAALLEGGATREVPADTLAVGDEVLVVPGTQVPGDGRVITGASHLDESSITGESLPKPKTVGDEVFGGTLNHEGALTVEITRAGPDGTLDRIVALVQEAEANRAPTARFIDRFSRAYTPAVLAAAVLTMLLPPLLAGADTVTWVYRGLALLLIGCPCALVLSVPAATASAIAAGARMGLLIKGGAVLEALASVRTVAFDKTGTLTEGRPVVTDVTGDAVDERRLLELAAAVEATSHHPLARAIGAHASDLGLAPAAAHDGRAHAGRAAEGTVDGKRVIVASPAHVREHHPLTPVVEHRIELLEDRGNTVVVVLWEREVAGTIALRDEPRGDSAAAITALRSLGVDSVLLTGDNARAARAVAADLGLEAHAELLPEDKHRHVAAFARDGGVAMVGDGINDAPALATADVGIAMGDGAHVALEAAHATVLRPTVRAVVDLLRLSRSAMGTVRANIAIALGLKAVFLTTTLLGITGLWGAIMADTGATALVTANALRLLRPSRKDRT